MSLFDVWKEYEKVAMHFNDLIIQLRTRSLGGVATLATVAGVVVRGDVTVDMRREVLMVTFSLLCLFWLAIWMLDFLYYNRLLLGAVSALLELERASATLDEPIAGGLALSTRIEASVKARHPKWGSLGRWVFYVTVMVALLAGLLLSRRA